MFGRHTTRNGDRMLIPEMDDQHLINTINLILERALAVRRAYNAAESIARNSELDMALIKIDKLSAEQAAARIQLMVENTYPYIAEATMRRLDLSSASDLLRQVVNRDGCITEAPVLAALNEASF